jgi:hypothetical protein
MCHKTVAKYIIEEAEKSVHCSHNIKGNYQSLEHTVITPTYTLSFVLLTATNCTATNPAAKIILWTTKVRGDNWKQLVAIPLTYETTTCWKVFHS